MTSPGETEAGNAGANHAEGQPGGIIEPMAGSAETHALALYTGTPSSSDDRPQCLTTPRPEGAEPNTNGERRSSISR